MSAARISPDRLAELLADQALQGLSHGDEQELDGAGAADDTFALAAAAVDLALFPPAVPMPVEVRARLEASAEAFIARRRSGADDPVLARISAHTAQPVPAPSVQPLDAPAPMIIRTSTRIPWIAAAACLGLAALSWLPRPQGGPDRAGGPQLADLSTQRNQLIAGATDLVKYDWQDWAAEGQGPEIAGVKGDVVFSPSTQSGYMRFTGLPDNPRQSQYQLWIVDQRGMGQRVSGAIFDSRSGGKELIVPISPRITVGRPAAFAVTIEQPGGTWVSDMKRRVVIAAAKG